MCAAVKKSRLWFAFGAMPIGVGEYTMPRIRCGWPSSSRLRPDTVNRGPGGDEGGVGRRGEATAPEGLTVALTAQAAAAVVAGVLVVAGALQGAMVG